MRMLQIDLPSMARVMKPIDSNSPRLLAVFEKSLYAKAKAGQGARPFKGENNHGLVSRVVSRFVTINM